jgi:hypothetical protein
MDITFNTHTVDVSVTLKAVQLYREKNYKACVTVLMSVLDVEPRNWQARLMLGACYFRTEQWGAAQRCFRFLVDQCTDPDTKIKALEGLQAATSRLERRVDIPMEFGSYVERSGMKDRLSWLD